MKNRFYFCRCFLYNNIFLKDAKIHIQYLGQERFKKDHNTFLQSKSADEVESIIRDIENEIRRRTTRFEDALRRQTDVSALYTPFHPDIFHLQESFLHPNFLELVNGATTGRKPEDLPHLTVISAEKRLYGFPVFTEDFVDRFNEELTNFEASSLDKGRPNSMNRFGITLTELGLDENFLDRLRTDFLEPVSKLCFPEWTLPSEPNRCCLDSHRAFTVQYCVGGDRDLHYHFDNAEVTLNVALCESHTGGELFFGDMADVPLSLSTCLMLDPLPKGYGLFHRGQQIHGALPIVGGCRQNLVMWMRSSGRRNLRCPMCGGVPDLEPAPLGTSGDGFTRDEEETMKCHLI